jgi:hypothetical protein
MKKLFYLLIVISLFGCTNNSNNNQELAEKEPEQMKNIDANLKEVAQEYLNSKLTLDIEKASSYMHLIAWDLLKLKLPEEKDINSIKRRIKEIYRTSGIKEMNEEYRMKIIVGNIIDSNSFKDDYLYLLSYERKGENKFDKIYEKSITIAITEDKGGSWKFIGVDTKFISETKGFLLKNYPENIVNEIFESINNGLNSGSIEIGFTASNSTEKNLVKDFHAYIDAFYNGDANTAISYIYTGVFEHLKNIFQEDYSIKEVKTIFKESNIDKVREQLGNKTLKTNISRILNKVEYENSLIYVISFSLKSGDQNDQVSVGGEAIAISKDNGKNWKFFERDDESVIPVLSIKFSNQIITKVLNYEYKK